MVKYEDWHVEMALEKIEDLRIRVTALETYLKLKLDETPRYIEKENKNG